MARGARSDLVVKAICAGVLGQIDWKAAAADSLRAEERTSHLTPMGIRADLRQEVLRLGATAVQARAETDPYWLEIHPEDPWWYKVVLITKEFPQGLMVKMKLVDPEDEDDPFVQIVSCHL
jgi:hypothetical protein